MKKERNNRLLNDQDPLKVAVIGLGLIGGSIAKTLRKSGTLFRISAFDRDEITLKAIEDGIIDTQLKSIEDALSSDIIFLCLPLGLSLQIFEELAPRLHENTILTDVCGIKGRFEVIWDSIDSKGVYIGGHPMTGKEKSGYSNSDPLLFENALYIISDRAKESALMGKFLAVVQLLGARAVFLDPYVHDTVVAKVSHLPQLLSVALVNSVAKDTQPTVNAMDFAAGGFRDMTRIASSSFEIWKDVISINKNEILSALDSLFDELKHLKETIINADMDGLEKLFDLARIRRNEIPKNTKGFITPLSYISIYVKDEPGIISKFSTVLYNRSINIKDIELLKVRQGTGGTFQLAFESKNECEKAKGILTEAGFDIFDVLI